MLLDNLANKINILCSRISRLEKEKNQALIHLEFDASSQCLTFPANSSLKFENIPVAQNLALVDDSDVVALKTGFYKLDVFNGYATDGNIGKVSDGDVIILAGDKNNVKTFREDPYVTQEEMLQILTRGVMSLRTNPHYTHNLLLTAGDAVSFYAPQETTFEPVPRVIVGTQVALLDPEFRIIIQWVA